VKKRVFRIVLAVVAVWFLMFAIDLISFLTATGPIFMVIDYYGGEVTPYLGLGYWILEFFPEVTPDAPYERSYEIHVIPYVVINTVIIAALVIAKIRERKASRES